jgi:hypothetical protein
MARPKKQTVDYFPHYCDHKTTMFILEQRYGNDGYAFWFKLLETIGNEEGHWLDLRDVMKWEFLQAKTHLSGDLCQEILDLLSKLKAIDSELWGIRVVWCGKFVDGLTPVYGNRRVEIPQRPTFLLVEIENTKISTPEKPQSKVDESKVDESKVDTSPELCELQAFISIPLNDKSEYPIDIKLIEEWKNLFPKIDVEQCLRNIRAWNLSHTRERKTKNGILKHITTWLAKEQDKGGNGNGGSGFTGSKSTAFGQTGGAQSDGEPYPVDYEIGPG